MIRSRCYGQRIRSFWRRNGKAIDQFLRQIENNRIQPVNQRNFPNKLKPLGRLFRIPVTDFVHDMLRDEYSAFRLLVIPPNMRQHFSEHEAKK